MPRASIKENKSLYQQKREELGLSREKAAELLQFITPERIERIESGKSNAHPDEVVLMAEKYQCPHLCNYFCANECEIGKQYVPEIKPNKSVSSRSLRMASSRMKRSGTLSRSRRIWRRSLSRSKPCSSGSSRNWHPGISTWTLITGSETSDQ